MKSRATMGVLLVIVGVALLLGRLGVVEWYRIVELIRFWPVVLIAFGISLLFPKRSWVMPALMVALIVAGGAYLVLNPAADAGTHTVDLEAGPVGAGGLVELETDISFAAGELVVSEGADHAANLHARYTSAMEEPQLTFEGDGDRGRVVMSYPKTSQPWFKWPGGPERRHDVFDLKLHDNLVHSINADFAAGLGRFDLRKLAVAELTIEMAAGKVEAELGVPEISGVSSTSVSVDMAAGQFELTVPDEAGVKFKLSKVAGSTNVDQLDWRKEGDTYYSPNYDEADYRIEVSAELVAGSFDIRTK